MAIGSPPITWDLKHTGEPWVYIGTPLPNPSGNTGVMVCYVLFYTLIIPLYIEYFASNSRPIPRDDSADVPLC